MRLRRVRSEETVTLFPFLAVLICTMGSLIVLLVVVVQQARASAESVTQNQEENKVRRATELQERQFKKDTLDWKIQMLQASRDETLELLSDKRLEISHLEDHIRKLRSQLESMRQRAQDIKQNSTDNLEDLKRELGRFESELEIATDDYERARKEYENRERSYALVPYDGPHGTKRRPMFIECLADRVVLQPEGVTLTGKDFQPPITNDNPLALGLRAKREYLASLSTDENLVEPYPLLVVRPKGARAYAAARMAMKAWDSEFGYELIPADLKLAYEKRDPAMAATVQEAVDDGRERRRRLQQIAPARFGRASGTRYRISRNGGFARSDGGTRGRYTSHDSGSNDGSWSPNGDTFDGSRGGVGSEGGRPFGGFSAERNQTGTGRDAGLTGIHRNGKDENYSGENGFTKSSGVTKDGGFSEDGGNGDRSFKPGSQRNGTHDPQARFAQNGSNTRDGDLNDSSTANDGRPGQRGNQNPHGGSGTSARSGGTGSAGGPSGGSASIGTPVSSGQQSLADQRGTNWGLPNRSQGATGIEVPITLVVRSKQVVLKKDPISSVKPQCFAFQNSVSEQVDPMISAIWERMRNWGVAGTNMYWKPVLNVEVALGAERTFTELSSLLEGSGIPLRKKKR